MEFLYTNCCHSITQIILSGMLSLKKFSKILHFNKGFGDIWQRISQCDIEISFCPIKAENMVSSANIWRRCHSEQTYRTNKQTLFIFPYRVKHEQTLQRYKTPELCFGVHVYRRTSTNLHETLLIHKRCHQTGETLGS